MADKRLIKLLFGILTGKQKQTLLLCLCHTRCNFIHLNKNSNKKEKHDDEEITLQLIFTLFRFFLHPETRQAIISCDDILFYLYLYLYWYIDNIYF